MNRVNIFKKISLFKTFKKVIKKNTDELNIKYGLRVDKSYRLYTVLNIPEDLIGEAYSLKTSDINKISENYIREYSSELSDYLNTKNLNELYKTYEVKKVSKYSYLLVFGFSLMRSNVYYNYLYFLVYPLLVLSLVIIGFILAT